MMFTAIWALLPTAAVMLLVSSIVMLFFIPLAVLGLIALAALCLALAVDPSNIIPASRAGAKIPLLWLSWVLFGNDEDGIAGEHGGVPTFDGEPVTWRQVLRWNIRNPLHNLTHHVIAMPDKGQRVLFGIPSKNLLWPAGHVLLAINGMPCFSFQYGPIEGYAGWRPRVVAGQRVGVFGLALRKR